MLPSHNLLMALQLLWLFLCRGSTAGGAQVLAGLTEGLKGSKQRVPHQACVGQQALAADEAHSVADVQQAGQARFQAAACFLASPLACTKPPWGCIPEQMTVSECASHTSM